MRTVSHPDFTASPAAGHYYTCPAGCDLPDMIRCWSRHLRELRADLDAARGYPDEEVLVVDLRNAEAHVAGLLAIARAKAQAA
jgi:hypothetical protein